MVRLVFVFLVFPPLFFTFDLLVPAKWNTANGQHTHGCTRGSIQQFSKVHISYKWVTPGAHKRAKRERASYSAYASGTSFQPS